MQSYVSLFSSYVIELNAQAHECGTSGLVDWGVERLSEILRFDCAWYGWGKIDHDGPVIHASSTLNLPDGYYQNWTEIADQDVLVSQFQVNPYRVATYDRDGTPQTDGMQSLSDAYGITRMATAMRIREGRSTSLYLSVYRSGASANAWSREECSFLQCAVDNISAAATMSAKQETSASDKQTASVYLTDDGVSLVGFEMMKERFGHIWSKGDGDRLPRFLTDYISQPGEHLLIDHRLVAKCEPVRNADGLTLQKLTLRPMEKYDLLTSREQDVARMLASGKSHKEAARIFGVAPSTIRNQTQSIYDKLGVDNRAALATAISAQANVG